jgi:hypothetical protein
MRAECEVEVVESERLITDGDGQILATARAVYALVVCHGDSKPCSATKFKADALGGVEIHKIVGGPQVHESGDPSVIDDDVKLHGAPHVGTNAGERVDGDHGRVGVVHLCVIVFCHLDAEQLFAHLLVPVREEFIAMETLPILVVLGHLGGGQSLSGRCGLGYRW